MNIKKLLVGAAGLAAAASLIGLGAGASFSQSATASQHVSVGTIGLEISLNGTSGWVPADGGVTITPPLDNLSSAMLGSHVIRTVYVRNTGSLPMFCQTSYQVDGAAALITNVTVTGPMSPSSQCQVAAHSNALPVAVNFDIPALPGNSAMGLDANLTVKVSGSDQAA